MSSDPHDERREHIERVRRGEYRAPASVPLPDPVLPEEEARDQQAPEGLEKRPYSAVVGSVLLAVLACIPHWVAIFVAVAVACVGIPIAWGFRRITTGRQQRMYIAVTATLLITLGLAVASVIVWMNVGVLTIPGLPEL